ncbi:MAG: DUF2934 domain-containing protein [Sandaracinus sp.]|nr:DUF2934 domain-containing protein [Sandaracinus sp.]
MAVTEAAAVKDAPKPKPAVAAKDAPKSKPAEAKPTTATAPRKPSAPAAAANPSATDVVRERAYLLAESNHFAGDPLFYWRVAERELGVQESK